VGSTTTVTAAKFFAADRSIDGPPMSICSMTSSADAPAFRAVFPSKTAHHFGRRLGIPQITTKSYSAIATKISARDSNFWRGSG